MKEVSKHRFSCSLIASLLGVFMLTGILFPSFLFVEATETEQESLRQQLGEIQAQIDAYRAKIRETGDQELDLKGQITTLDNKINKLNLEIESLSLAVSDTNRRITVIRNTTREIENTIDNEKRILSQTIKIIHENDQFNYVEIFFREDKLSDVFSDIKALEEIQEALLTSLSEIRDLKIRLEDEKIALEERQNELSGLKSAQEIQTTNLNQNKDKKRNLLFQTQDVKNQLIDKVEVSKMTVESIRAQLYNLQGHGVSIQFIDALKYAQIATTKSGVRAAMLLAMLKQESEWGSNVGTGTWRSDMNTRDHDAFIQITKELGLDPDTTPVSRKPSYGWGGAMGPAQFLPQTWLSYKDEVARATGHNPPNPWDIGDAFMACGIKLSHAGADAQTYNEEWKAAQVYFAGRRWNNPAYYFYGDSVMELTETFQKQIDILEEGGAI